MGLIRAGREIRGLESRVYDHEYHGFTRMTETENFALIRAGREIRGSKFFSPNLL